MDHKKFLSLFFSTFLCFFLCITSAWADNGNPLTAEGTPENSDENSYFVDTAANQEVNETVSENGHLAEPVVQEANTVSENSHLIEPIAIESNHETVSESELELDGFKSWQKGFDLRLHVGLGSLIADSSEMVNFFDALTDQESSSGITGFFSGHFNLELGYRWAYGGIYFKFGVSPTLAYETVDDENGEEKEVSKCLLWPDAILLGKFYIPLVDNWELILNAGFAFTSVVVLYTGVGAQWHLGDMSLGFEVIYERAIASFFIWEFNFNLIAGTFVLGYTF